MGTQNDKRNRKRLARTDDEHARRWMARVWDMIFYHGKGPESKAVLATPLQTTWSLNAVQVSLICIWYCLTSCADSVLECLFHSIRPIWPQCVQSVRARCHARNGIRCLEIHLHAPHTYSPRIRARCSPNAGPTASSAVIRPNCFP